MDNSFDISAYIHIEDDHSPNTVEPPFSDNRGNSPVNTRYPADLTHLSHMESLLSLSSPGGHVLNNFPRTFGENRDHYRSQDLNQVAPEPFYDGVDSSIQTLTSSFIGGSDSNIAQPAGDPVINIVAPQDDGTIAHNHYNDDAYPIYSFNGTPLSEVPTFSTAAAGVVGAMDFDSSSPHNASPDYTDFLNELRTIPPRSPGVYSLGSSVSSPGLARSTSSLSLHSDASADHFSPIPFPSSAGSPYITALEGHSDLEDFDIQQVPYINEPRPSFPQPSTTVSSDSINDNTSATKANGDACYGDVAPRAIVDQDPDTASLPHHVTTPADDLDRAPCYASHTTQPVNRLHIKQKTESRLSVPFSSNEGSRPRAISDPWNKSSNIANSQLGIDMYLTSSMDKNDDLISSAGSVSPSNVSSYDSPLLSPDIDVKWTDTSRSSPNNPSTPPAPEFMSSTVKEIEIGSNTLAVPLSRRPRSLSASESQSSGVGKQKPQVLFPCELCSKKFTRAYNLRSHMRTHTDERPFECSLCGKTFARQHDRKRHEELHSGEKKFICHGESLTATGMMSWGCKRRFARADALGRHFRTVAGKLCLQPLVELVKANGANVKLAPEGLVFSGVNESGPVVYLVDGEHEDHSRRTVILAAVTEQLGQRIGS